MIILVFRSSLTSKCLVEGQSLGSVVCLGWFIFNSNAHLAVGRHDGSVQLYLIDMENLSEKPRLKYTYVRVSIFHIQYLHHLLALVFNIYLQSTFRFFFSVLWRASYINRWRLYRNRSKRIISCNVFRKNFRSQTRTFIWCCCIV